MIDHGRSYPEERTIIRQDQRPACFYIILSGLAIVTYKRYTDDHIQTLDLLERGCTFGVRMYLDRNSNSGVFFFSLQGKRFDEQYGTEIYGDIENASGIISSLEGCK